MLLVDRELLGDFLKAFAGLLLLIALVFFVDTLIDYFQRILSLGEEGLVLGAVYYLGSLPENTVEAFPVAASAAILWVVMNKARTNEILAYMAGGLSPLRLAAPLLGGALIAGILGMLISEFVTPAASQAAWRADRLLRGYTEQSITRDRDVYQAGADGRFYILDAYDSAAATMERPRIVDIDPENGAPVWMLRAERGILSENAEGGEEWLFEDVVVQQWDENRELVESRMESRLWESDLDRPMERSLPAFLTMLRQEERLGFLEMRQYIDLLREQGKDTTALEAQLHSRLSLPLGAVALALVICAHVMRPTAQKILWGFGGGLAFIVLFYLLFFALKGVTELAGAFAAGFGAWATNVIYAVVGAAMLWRNAR